MPIARPERPLEVIAVRTADVTDRKGALQALGRCAADLQAVQSLLADGGYVVQPFAQAVEELLGAEVQIAKRSELHNRPPSTAAGIALRKSRETAAFDPIMTNRRGSI